MGSTSATGPLHEIQNPLYRRYTESNVKDYNKVSIRRGPLAEETLSAEGRLVLRESLIQAWVSALW